MKLSHRNQHSATHFLKCTAESIKNTAQEQYSSFDTSPNSKAEQNLRFIDICAGLGGFHYAFKLAQDFFFQQRKNELDFKCVFACDIDEELRSLYVKNFPDISDTYRTFFPPKKEGNLTDLYDNDDVLQKIHGDLSDLIDIEREQLKTWINPDTGLAETIIPDHEILCAGFPCQPFSKSGSQKGFLDIRGTVFGMISIILEQKRPAVVLLENVGNFERHDKGNTWNRVYERLHSLGYSVEATTHVASGANSQGLLSPHHIGFPHHRERFFIVAVHDKKCCDYRITINKSPFPYRRASKHTSAPISDTLSIQQELTRVLVTGETLASDCAMKAASLPESRLECIDLWNELLSAIADCSRQQEAETLSLAESMPSFPIWGYELDPWQWYPLSPKPIDLVRDDKLLARAWRERFVTAQSLISPPENKVFLKKPNPSKAHTEKWVQSWPAYATREAWPDWKIRFITQNRAWALRLIKHIDAIWLRSWLDKLSCFAPSLQKLEWNCKGEQLDLYRQILQFRPSGLRAKKFYHVPALVAMTTTQVPIVPVQTESARELLNGAKSRYLLPSEALELQGFPAEWHTPQARTLAYKAFGNAVHAGLVKEIIVNIFK